MNQLTHQVLVEALKHVGVREVGHNDGPEVREWLHRVARGPGNPWCAAFAWCMLDDACQILGLLNPLPPIAGVHFLMTAAKSHRVWTDQPGPGFLFFIDHGKNSRGEPLGHCGIVVDVNEDEITTVEGNTTESGGRDGDRVAMKTRKASAITWGYLDPGELCAGQQCTEEHPGDE